MELRQIRHFLAVAEYENFTRAAQAMHIVQSALSTSIKQLEDELGTSLFIRSTRKVRLTMAGRVFLKYAKNIMSYVSKATQEVEAIVSLKSGSISVGTVQSIPPFIDLPILLKNFINKFPDFDVKLCQGSSSELNEKVQNQQVDLAIMPIEEVSDLLASKIIACDSIVVVYAKDSGIFKIDDGSVSVSALSKLSFIDFERGQGTRDINDKFFDMHNVERKITFEVSDLETLIGLVEKDMGIALLPEDVASSRGDKLEFKELKEENLCWELAVVWLSDGPNSDKIHERPVKEFMDILEQGI